MYVEIGSGEGSAVMSNDQVTRSGGSVAPTNGFAVGLTLFAAVMMMMVGVFQAIQGVVALFNDTFYVAGEKWVFSFDITTWGWIHLVMGVVVAAAGFFVLQGAVWARAVGVAVAALSAVLNFAWLPYYPVWSLLIIALVCSSSGRSSRMGARSPNNCADKKSAVPPEELDLTMRAAWSE